MGCRGLRLIITGNGTTECVTGMGPQNVVREWDHRMCYGNGTTECGTGMGPQNVVREWDHRMWYGNGTTECVTGMGPVKYVQGHLLPGDGSRRGH